MKPLLEIVNVDTLNIDALEKLYAEYRKVLIGKEAYKEYLYLQFTYKKRAFDMRVWQEE